MVTSQRYKVKWLQVKGIRLNGYRSKVKWLHGQRYKVKGSMFNTIPRYNTSQWAVYIFVVWC